ncbi:MAG TPA: ABC transporter ATP-binding protein [Anaerolineae bacterium]|nr:ABC transporter ATP-binding protein [Anaerolineae bacterium]HIQ08164.1 ABC transporter ATP-binding protein [Anaerolineaceae bacterium]
MSESRNPHGNGAPTPRRKPALMVGHNRAALMPAEKPKDFKGALLQLLGYMGGYRYALAAALLIAVIATVLNIVGPKILGQATTTLFEGIMARISGTGDIDFGKIGQILLTVLGLYAASAVFHYIQGWMMVNISMDIAYRLRRDIAAKIHRLPLRYFDRTTYGEVLSRVTNDVDVINQTFSQGLSQTVTSVVSLVGILVMMLTISWQMTLVALLVLPLSGVLVRVVVKRSQRYFGQQQEYLGHLNGHVEETFGGHLVIKAFGNEEQRVSAFDRLNQVLYGAAWKSQFFSGIMMPLMLFVGNLGYVAVSVLGGFLAIRNLVTVGDIQAFLQYVRNFTQPIQRMANIANVLQSTAAAAERVFAFLNEPEEVPDPENPVVLDKVEGRVEFRHVRFSYIPGKPVIKDFSARIEPGQKVAIVGPTGAGKTTLVKLLMRFYDVDKGAILIDGHDIREFRRADLRRMFGMVLQDTWLFNGTIMENIRYGRPNATDEEVIAAARAAHADHFIRTLPEGYNTVINEESTNISSGEKQLLTIARAFLADPPMLILDEATSNVDTRTELLIQRAMDRLMEGRTSFVIAHRLSTIRNADNILVIHEGDIIEQGTHEELLARGGFYAEMYYSQFDILDENGNGAASEGLRPAGARA